MIIRIRLFLASIWRWYRRRALYVIADPRDNSVTLSRLLFEHMCVMKQETAKVFVFRLGNAAVDSVGKSGAIYAFSLNPPLGDRPTQLCDIQYNSKHRTIGFETLCPSVNRIFYDYGLPSDKPAKLSVDTALAIRTDMKAKDEPMLYYIILPPHAVTRS